MQTYDIAVIDDGRRGRFGIFYDSFFSSDPFLQYSNRARKHQISSVAFTQLNRFTVCKKLRVGGSDIEPLNIC